MAKKKTKKIDYRKLVSDELDAMHKARVIATSLKSKLYQDKAKEEFQKYAKDALFKYVLPGKEEEENKYLVKEDEFKAMDEKRQQETINAGFEFRNGAALETIVRSLKDNSEDIFKIKGNFDPKLASIGNAKEIVESTPDKYQEFAELHRNYLDYQNMLRDIKDGKKPKARDKEQMQQLYAGAAAKAEYDHMKKLKYSDELAELAAKISGAVGAVNPKNANVEKGAKYIMKEIEKKMKLKDGQTVEGRAGEYISAALTGMIKSGNPEREMLAVQLYGLAQKGYQIGDQKFDEVFKKEDKKKK